MKETLYKYHGAGNDFIIIDNRDGHIKEEDLVTGGRLEVTKLCNRHYGIGSDGLMLLEEPKSGSAGCCFRMRFFNPDGSEGMMCGNGGRCIVAFAAYCGVLPANGILPAKCNGHTDSKTPGKYIFEAPDGIHEAYISGVPSSVSAQPADSAQCASIDTKPLSAGTAANDKGYNRQPCLWIRLKMKDVNECQKKSYRDKNNGIVEGLFLNTGARHFVTFTENVESCDVVTKGRLLRYDKAFAPEGANINFVEPQRIAGPQDIAGGPQDEEHSTIDSGHDQVVTPATAAVPNVPTIKVRTYEKGVEDETEACGTGITASAIASCIHGIAPHHIDGNGVYHYAVRARRETLEVEFKPEFSKDILHAALDGTPLTDTCVNQADGKSSLGNSVTISPVASSVWLSGPAERVAEIIYGQ